MPPAITPKRGAAATAILALIAGISYLIIPSPQSLGWDKVPDIIDNVTINPDQQQYFYTITSTNLPTLGIECSQEWTFGLDSATLRNKIHVGGGFGQAVNPEYGCDISKDIIYVLGGDSKWWSWGGSQWNLVGPTTPTGAVPYPIKFFTYTAQLMEVTCIDEMKPVGWTCKAPFKQVKDKLPGETIDLTVYSVWNNVQSPPSMSVRLQDAVVVIQQESFNSNQIESR